METQLVHMHNNVFFVKMKVLINRNSIMFTLYYKPTCPFCQRVFEVSDNLGIEFDLRDISEDEDARKELIEQGGKQQVPFLIDTENDVSMYESGDIIDYIREHGVKSEKSADANPRVHVGGSTCVSCEG